MLKFLKSLFYRSPASKVDAISSDESVRDVFISEKENSNTPWAMFEIDGFEDKGRIKVQFSWNEAFIKKIKELGFDGENDQDRVQLFFYASQMRPTELTIGDDPVQSDQHPRLSDQLNTLKI